MQELGGSSNVLLQLEANALALADADDEQQMAAAFTNLFNCILENRDVFVANNVEVLYLDWSVKHLVSAMTANGIASETKDSLNHLFYSEYSPKLQAMDQEYWAKTVPAGQVLSAFEKQKQYLKENRRYDFFEFVNLFQSRGYSKNQAFEIQPLIAAYKSNLVFQSQSASGMQRGELMGAIAQVGFLENDVKRILNPPVVACRDRNRRFKHPNPPRGEALPRRLRLTNAPEIVTHVIGVDKFFPIPVERLIDLGSFERISPLGITITVTAHHWFEGKVFLDFQYGASIEMLDEKEMRSAVVKQPALPLPFSIPIRKAGTWSIVRKSPKSVWSD